MSKLQMWGPVCGCALLLGGTFTPAAATDKRYLIVAARDYASTAAASQLAAARTARGFTVSLYGVPTGTTRETIKAYIASWYVPGTESYVVIIGDTSGNGAPSTATAIPHWSGGGSHAAPTDLPYACMGGTGDWTPEIYLGRIAVDTTAELGIVVSKTLLVENGVFSNPSYVQRAMFAATDDSSAQAAATHDWVIANYLTPAGFTATRVYAAQGGSTTGVVNAINAGSLFNVYMGHSGFSGWWNPAFSSTEIQALTNNGLYGLILGMSCGTAGFDWTYGECMGEYWLRQANKGGAAFIASTMIIPTDWETARRSEKYFFGTIFTEGVWEAGPAWHGAMQKLYDDPAYGPSDPDTRDYFELFVLLGDPALRLPHVAIGDGDYDEDGDVDLADFAGFQGCFGSSALGPACVAGNLAGGMSVEAADWALYEGVMTGPE